MKYLKMHNSIIITYEYRGNEITIEWVSSW